MQVTESFSNLYKWILVCNSSDNETIAYTFISYVFLHTLRKKSVSYLFTIVKLFIFILLSVIFMAYMSYHTSYV